MNEGLVQLLVIGFFVIVSLMDGAARKRRKQAQEMGHAPGLSLPQDADDGLVEGAESSEGMVPRDLWEEIAALSRGEVPERGIESASGPATRSDSSYSPDTLFDPSLDVERWNAREDTPGARAPDSDEGADIGWSPDLSDRLDASLPREARPRDLQSGYAHPDQAASHEWHAHERHAESLSLSQQASAPAPSPDAGRAPRRAGASRGLLKGISRGDRGALREAIILSEVLNPPVAFRDPGRRPPGDD
jgi:hypothetical protein